MWVFDLPPQCYYFFLFSDNWSELNNHWSFKFLNPVIVFFFYNEITDELESVVTLLDSIRMIVKVKYSSMVVELT